MTYTGPIGWGDYAVCGGSNYVLPSDWNGTSYRAWYPDRNTYLNPAQVSAYESWTGWRYMITFQKITDGLSHTFLAGEKYYPRGASGGVLFNGDNQDQYVQFAGHDGTQDPQTGRWTIGPGASARRTTPAWGSSSWPTAACAGCPARPAWRCCTAWPCGTTAGRPWTTEPRPLLPACVRCRHVYSREYANCLDNRDKDTNGCRRRLGQALGGGS